MMNNRQMPPEQSAHLCSGRLAGASFKSPSTFQFLPERSDSVRPIEVNAAHTGAFAEYAELALAATACTQAPQPPFTSCASGYFEILNFEGY